MIFSASLDQLYAMMQLIRQEASQAGFDNNTIFKIELAAEEALVNIINYAYRDNGGKVEIICHQENSPKSLVITLKDQGVAFDPIKQAPPIDSQTLVEEKPIGGYGIFLIRKIMDEIRYKREGDANILTLVKYVP